MGEDKFDQWLEETKQYAVEKFWKEVLNQKNASEQKKDANSPWLPFDNQRQHDIALPRCDIGQSDGKIIVEAELPGVSPENIAYRLQGKKLVINGAFTSLHPGWTYVQKERQERSFERELHIPEQIDASNISSTLKDGILTITLPVEAEEEAVSVHIPLRPAMDDHRTSL